MKQSVVPVYFLDFGDYSLHLFYTGIYLIPRVYIEEFG